MTELDRLPPDQRAVLSLVLDRGKSYAEVAELLGIPENTVRDRAHTALDALADGGDAPGGPRVPRNPTVRPQTPQSTTAASKVTTGAGAGLKRTGAADASSAPPPPQEPRGPQASASSRRAGALLLGAIVVVVVVVVVLVSSGGGKGSTPTTAATNTTTTGTKAGTETGTSSTSTTSATKPKLDSTIRLSPPVEAPTNATGVAYVLSDGSKRAFYVAAQGLPPSTGFFYAVWLYNSPSNAEPLGRAPSVSSNGRMQGGNPLPSNAADYAKFIITRETSTHPSHPGPTVLSGSFTLH